MEFRLTYAGELAAYKDRDKRQKRRHSFHIHDVRKHFHKQLKVLWEQHPIMRAQKAVLDKKRNFDGRRMHDFIPAFGFEWLPIVTKENGLICKLDILMLRSGEPGKVIHDVDNRLKTLFDALRMPDSKEELGAGTDRGQATPDPDEIPFYVLLQDDREITHVSVTTDTLLQPVPDVEREELAARLVVGVTVRPYMPYRENLGYAAN